MVVQTERIGQQPKQPGVEQNAPADALWTLFALYFVAIIPFWTVRYPVVTDYPNHLARWFVLFHMKDAAYHFANFYAPAWGPLPYISPDILAMALQHFLPIDVVGRCILSLCIVLVAAATYFFLKKACPENVGLAGFGILVAFNPNFLMGSISNEFSLAFCLLVVGLWVSYCKDPKITTAVGIAAGLLLVYLSHLSGFVVAGLAMGVYALFQEQRWKKLGILAILSLPALLIFVHNPSHAGSGASFVYAGLTVWDKLRTSFLPRPTIYLQELRSHSVSRSRVSCFSRTEKEADIYIATGLVGCVRHFALGLLRGPESVWLWWLYRHPLHALRVFVPVSSDPI